jgi:hypothetical protein
MEERERYYSFILSRTLHGSRVFLNSCFYFAIIKVKCYYTVMSRGAGERRVATVVPHVVAGSCAEARTHIGTTPQTAYSCRRKQIEAAPGRYGVSFVPLFPLL